MIFFFNKHSYERRREERKRRKEKKISGHVCIKLELSLANICRNVRLTKSELFHHINKVIVFIISVHASDSVIATNKLNHFGILQVNLIITLFYFVIGTVVTPLIKG